MNLQFYLEYASFPQPMQLFLEEDEIKGKTNSGRGWYNVETKEFFILAPGQNHYDNSVAKKMQQVGWLAKTEGQTLEDARNQLFTDNKIVRFIIDTKNEAEPITIESGGTLGNAEYIGLMKLMKAKVMGPLQKTAKILWESGKATGSAIKKYINATEWQLA